MNKVILFLWFGDQKPPYVQWTLDNFRKMNPGWEIRYIEYSNYQLENYKEQNDQILTKLLDEPSVKHNTPKYISRKYIWNYLNSHSDEFIIYCDLDCFPIAPFDNFIFDRNYTNDKQMPQWIAQQCDLSHRKWGPAVLGSWGFRYKNLQCIKGDTWCLCNNNGLPSERFFQLHKGSTLDDTLTFYNSMFINEKFKFKYEQRQIDFLEMNIKLGDNFCLTQFTPVEHYHSKKHTLSRVMHRLKDLCESKIQLDLRKIFPDSPCPLGNSGIISLNDETYLTVFNEFDYQLPSYEKIYKPISKFCNCWGLLDNNFAPIGENIKANIKIDNQTFGWIDRLSDSRLFNWNNEIFCSGTAMSIDTYVGKVHICKNELTVDVQYRYHNEKRKEKNWLAIPSYPFKFIYEVKKDRTRIIDTQTNEISEVGHLISINKDNLRGNTPLLQINENEFLAIFHTRNDWSNYTHYFLIFDRNSRLIHMSRPFTFDTVHGVEFSISMFYVNKTNGKQIGISVCENDMYQYVYIFDKQKLIDFVYDNLDESAINMYCWNDNKNFGDLIAPKILEFLSSSKCKNITDKSTNKLLSIGSVLDIPNVINEGDVVWGSGVHKDCKIKTKNLDVRLVRGPLTRDVLLKNGISAPQKYCDPGVLAPFCYNIDRKQTIIRDILVLLHFDDDKQKVSQCLDKLGIHYMYMDKDDIKSILNEIAKSRRVVSSSLHGIIAAEALGKPAVLLQESGNHESMFKYTDYYLGSGRTENVIKTTTLDQMQEDVSKVKFTIPAKFDLHSLIKTFPLKLKDNNIMDKMLKYYNDQTHSTVIKDISLHQN